MSALDEMWVIGDIFLSIAAMDFNAVRKDKLDKHIASHYDVRFIFTPLDAECNFLLRILNAFIGYANQVPKLPHFIVIMLDVNYQKTTCNYQFTEKATGWLVSAIFLAIRNRKTQLPDFAYHSSEPKLLFIKPAPKSKNRGLDGENRNHR